MLPFSEPWRTALWLCAGAAAFLFGERLAIRYGAGALARRWVGLPAGGLVALGCAARFGGVQAVLALIACALLYALGRVDAATMVLPDPLCALLGLLALPWVLAARLGGAAWGPLLFEHTVSAVTISLPLALLRRVWPGCLGGTSSFWRPRGCGSAGRLCRRFCWRHLRPGPGLWPGWLPAGCAPACSLRSGRSCAPQRWSHCLGAKSSSAGFTAGCSEYSPA